MAWIAQRRAARPHQVPLSAGAHERVMGDDMDQTLRMALLSERLCKVLFYNVEWPSLGALPAVASCPPGEVPIHVHPRNVAPRHGGRQTGAVSTARPGCQLLFSRPRKRFSERLDCFWGRKPAFGWGFLPPPSRFVNAERAITTEQPACAAWSRHHQ